jgi:hypothetical protein
VEDFFDQIYHDLTPFWAQPAKDMRNYARHFEHHISVRNKTANMTDNHSQGTSRDCMEAWLDTVKSIQTMLPDLDMAINVMDESRVLAPWEEIDKYVQTNSNQGNCCRKTKSSRNTPISTCQMICLESHLRWSG